MPKKLLDENKLSMGLEELLNAQEYISGLVGAVNTDATVSDEQLRNVVLSLVVEIVELLNEFNWKPWKITRQSVHERKVQDEFADILAFIGLLMVYLQRYGITPTMLSRAYIQKSLINIDRFKSGY